MRVGVPNLRRRSNRAAHSTPAPIARRHARLRPLAAVCGLAYWTGTRGGHRAQHGWPPAHATPQQSTDDLHAPPRPGRLSFLPTPAPAPAQADLEEVGNDVACTRPQQAIRSKRGRALADPPLPYLLSIAA